MLARSPSAHSSRFFCHACPRPRSALTSTSGQAAAAGHSYCIGFGIKVGGPPYHRKHSKWVWQLSQHGLAASVGLERTLKGLGSEAARLCPSFRAPPWSTHTTRRGAQACRGVGQRSRGRNLKTLDCSGWYRRRRRGGRRSPASTGSPTLPPCVCCRAVQAGLPGAQGCSGRQLSGSVWRHLPLAPPRPLWPCLWLTERAGAASRGDRHHRLLPGAAPAVQGGRQAAVRTVRLAGRQACCGCCRCCRCSTGRLPPAGSTAAAATAAPTAAGASLTPPSG